MHTLNTCAYVPILIPALRVLSVRNLFRVHVTVKVWAWPQA